MSASPPPSEPRAEDDHLDRLLRDYFTTKAPREFPPLPLDSAASVTPLSRASSPLSRGRLILAACVVAVLLGFGWLLRPSPPAGPAPVGIGNDTTATGGAPHAKPAK